MREDLSYEQALQIFNSYYKTNEGKILIDLTDYKGPIGIRIEQLHWKAAFKSILEMNGFQMMENKKAYLISKTDTQKKLEQDIASQVEEMQDEIMIQVTFFEADMNLLRELGIDWSTLSNGKVEVNSNLQSADKVTENIFKLAMNHQLEIGSSLVDINAIFKAFESDGQGHIVSRPQITVLSGEEGYVHDGTSFSIKTQDEEGNTTDTFFDAGVIVTVRPKTKVDKNGKKFIELEVETERSSATPDAVSTTINISEAKTKKYLYNGEEAVVGGVTVKEEKEVRKGIPILKDLPWWFFGIRYLTGYDMHQTKAKELLILIKANIITDLHDRLEGRPDVKLDIENFRKGVPSIERKLIEPKDSE
jgi:type IV pilus assembly protein PilQ